PVIASNVPGCKETFIDGVSGLAVKVRDSDDLTRKIEEFINIPHEEKVQMGKANREHVEKNFDRKIVVEKYIECIEKYAR
ncbi:MAG: glycosyltransferase, partial [Anaerococcus sp.]|uniref:glycosyltransferase n=1 Tax=Anaerococcus sp. TaxID=1872515 RepID=UPI00290146B3